MSRDPLSCSTFRTLRETLRQNLQNHVMSPRDHQINRAGRLVAVNYLDCRKFGSMLAWANVVRRRLESPCKVNGCAYARIHTHKIWRCGIFVNINYGFFCIVLRNYISVVTNCEIMFFFLRNNKRKSSTAERIMA